eukprot:scaffold48023_cov28-Tisochrysis_lutea.AAC.2
MTTVRNSNSLAHCAACPCGHPRSSSARGKGTGLALTQDRTPCRGKRKHSLPPYATQLFTSFLPMLAGPPLPPRPHSDSPPRQDLVLGEEQPIIEELRGRRWLSGGTAWAATTPQDMCPPSCSELAIFGGLEIEGGGAPCASWVGCSIGRGSVQ